MNHLTSILTLRQSAETTVAWIMQRLMARSFQVEQTFDLNAARMSQVDCPCPYHGTNNCTCQMIVLLARGQKTQPVTIVVHGHDDQTWLSVVDIENRATNENVVQALLPVIENSEI
jgi:hypothetical protein